MTVYLIQDSHRIATIELLFNTIKDSDRWSYCNTNIDTFCYALIKCQRSSLLRNDAEKWLNNTAGEYIEMVYNENIFRGHDDIP